MDEGQKGGAHHAPGRNPQDDQSTDAGGLEDRERQGGDGGSYREGGQNEQTRR